MANKWIVDDQTGVFVEGGDCEPTPGPGQHVTTLPDMRMPDVVTERYDLTSPTKRRPATAAELAAASNAALEAGLTRDVDEDRFAALVAATAARLNIAVSDFRQDVINALRVRRRGK